MTEAVKTPWKMTRREAEILDALCRHGSNKAVARALNIAQRTVDAHVIKIWAKMRIAGLAPEEAGVGGYGNRTRGILLWYRWRLRQGIDLLEDA